MQHSNKPAKAKLKNALYGLMSAGAAFCPLLADTIIDLGYRPATADPDVWLRSATKKRWVQVL